MNTPETDDQLLEALIVGDRNRDEPEIRALLERRPELAERLERLRTLARGLSHAGEEQERLLAEALAEVGLADLSTGNTAEDQLVERKLRELARAANGRPRARVWFVRIAVAAAILVASLPFVGNRLFGDAATRDPATDPRLPTQEAPIYLDATATPSALTPSGLVDSFKKFTWTGPLPAAGSWQVIVYADGVSASFDALLQSPRLDLAEWEPTSSELAELPAKIRWELIRRDVSGARFGSVVEARAQRSR